MPNNQPKMGLVGEWGRLGSHARDAADFLAWRAALPLKEILASF